MINHMTKKKPKAYATKSQTKSLRPSIANKEDLNSLAMPLFSKKEMLHSTSAQPAYGIPILMVQLLSNMKMTNYIALSAYSVLLHKINVL